MLLGNKRYNLFLPYFFHAEVDKKRLAIVLDPEAAFIYSKKLPSEGGGGFDDTELFSWTKMHCLWRRDKSQIVFKD